jgi:hypothetical protein
MNKKYKNYRKAMVVIFLHAVAFTSMRKTQENDPQLFEVVEF